MTMKRERMIKGREAAKLSQDELAGLCGVTRWTINRIELGERNPSYALMLKIIEATGGAVTANDFLPESSEAA